MRIDYTGGPQGWAMLTRELETAGITVSYQPPEERRGAGDTALHGVLWVVQQGAAGLIGGATVTGALKAIAAVKARFPRVEIETDDSEMPALRI
ncbi:MAG: hypothetical protein IPL07_06220 [Acidimicrobiaceae bacterium]|nr:hypothetical protein [Acidimicrobiaceae bacterium]